MHWLQSRGEIFILIEAYNTYFNAGITAVYRVQVRFLMGYNKNIFGEDQPYLA